MSNIAKALVTGGAGFIGSHVVDALVQRNSRVVIYDNFSTGQRQFVPKRDGVEVHESDVLDLSRLKQAMVGCDFVFHFQGNADVRGGRSRTRIDLEQNTIATWNVLEAARLNGVRGFVFASSAAVYGEPEVFPTPEGCAGTQTSLYGASKVAGEAMIQAYCEYFDMRCFIFRFVSWIGERYSHGVIFDFLKKLRRDPRLLEILGDGQQKKSYLYVKDGVEGIMLGVRAGEAKSNTFNLGHHDYMSVVDLAWILLDEMGLRDVMLKFTGEKRGWVGDSPVVHLDTSRITRLGWKPSISIEEGVRRTVRFLLENPHLLQARE